MKTRAERLAAIAAARERGRAGLRTVRGTIGRPRVDVGARERAIEELLDQRLRELAQMDTPTLEGLIALREQQGREPADARVSHAPTQHLRDQYREFRERKPAKRPDPPMAGHVATRSLSEQYAERAQASRRVRGAR